MSTLLNPRARSASVGLLLAASAAGCASVPPPQTALRTRLEAVAARCAARDSTGERDTTAVYGAAFEAPGFTEAVPDRRNRSRMDRPGQVILEFVVDTTGHVDLCRVHVVQETEPGLSDRLLDTIAGWSFAPAEYQGHKVRQVIRLVETAAAAH